MTDSVKSSDALKADFCSGMRRLAAGVCVISTKVEGRRYAMTASSVTSLSDEPASLLVCVNQEATMYSLLSMGQPFVVNVLSQAQQQISNICAARDAGEERFSSGDWQQNEQGLPYLADAQATFFCQVDSDDMQYGTHRIVVGRIQKTQIHEGEASPLVYVDGRYADII